MLRERFPSAGIKSGGKGPAYSLGLAIPLTDPFLDFRDRMHSRSPRAIAGKSCDDEEQRNKYARSNGPFRLI